MVKHGEGADPAAVVFDTIAAAKARHCDVVICDTAGRLHNKKNLMDELAKISRIIDRELPGCDRENLLVLDAATGQNGVNQAREFMSAADITGIVLTKLDGTPKGGVVLPIKRELGLPVKFIGVGEQIDDLQPFDPEAFAAALFNLEDAQTAAAPETEAPEAEAQAAEEQKPSAPSAQAAPSLFMAAPAQEKPEEDQEAPEDKHARFRRFAGELMERLDRDESVQDLIPELTAWRDDRDLDRDDQRLVRNLLLTTASLGN